MQALPRLTAGRSFLVSLFAHPLRNCCAAIQATQRGVFSGYGRQPGCEGAGHATYPDEEAQQGRLP